LLAATWRARSCVNGTEQIHGRVDDDFGLGGDSSFRDYDPQIDNG
jgi:hypothetical protein